METDWTNETIIEALRDLFGYVHGYEDSEDASELMRLADVMTMLHSCLLPHLHHDIDGLARALDRVYVTNTVIPDQQLINEILELSKDLRKTLKYINIFVSSYARGVRRSESDYDGMESDLLRAARLEENFDNLKRHPLGAFFGTSAGLLRDLESESNHRRPQDMSDMRDRRLEIAKKTTSSLHSVSKLVRLCHLSDLNIVREEWLDSARLVESEMETYLEDTITAPLANRPSTMETAQLLAAATPLLKLGRLFMTKLTKSPRFKGLNYGNPTFRFLRPNGPTFRCLNSDEFNDLIEHTGKMSIDLVKLIAFLSRVYSGLNFDIYQRSRFKELVGSIAGQFNCSIAIIDHYLVHSVAAGDDSVPEDNIATIFLAFNLQLMKLYDMC
ncbi:hypothetical protein MJO28_001266 [Puccinia striiformis f. sp. tritici]|uniref:Uncharacterized protein n=3 Tax=Puccinia striiformis TaxID=27350 RepID=A0A0L0URH1_9BASI|nr:hypothetical protein Pst134EA_003480 [Puccinia striiformis f. sp. tritici]KAI9611685.1 hypothetical protein H4Q26_008640 [Puccinia striiformis f. sp. tritici PST-130]KNE89678.1 hypothetical protein PSTG_16841 [Puccinia striiformis f. sp. tritici PST-78]POV98809.1 hypothetical protein PSHT_13856 [Puccinia striiformis]KAH9465064.1 hypothetical protein Pst134EB_004552 [Puccinia striiformis f. sp. tritici]KAH9472881.1 hypothetical protein Pst134EA_003480 [Puccinia striiformis f. sp. tritici]